MLACLEERFYVLRDGQAGRYYLSLKLFQLSHTHSPAAFFRRRGHWPHASAEREGTGRPATWPFFITTP